MNPLSASGGRGLLALGLEPIGEQDLVLAVCEAMEAPAAYAARAPGQRSTICVEIPCGLITVCCAKAPAVGNRAPFGRKSSTAH